MPETKLVLLIEDNEDFQDLYGMIAEQAGYTVEKIRDGRQALERLGRGPVPTVVLLDSRLPGAGGEDILTAARARKEWLNVPIYLLTADTRASKKFGKYSPGSDLPNGVIEKGADAIRLLRELFKQYSGD